MFAILAQVPNLSEWMVWGPLGCLFGVGLWVFIDWYRGIQRPRMKAKAENEQEAHEAHLRFLDRTNESISSLAESNKTVAECIVRYDDRFDRLHGTVSDGFSHIHSRLESLCRHHPPSNPPTP